MKYRRSRPEVLCKKDVLKTFANFTRKNLYRILFLIKAAGFQSETSLKKRLRYSYFSVNFSASFSNFCKQLLLKIVKKIITFRELFHGFTVISFTFFAYKT